MYITQFESVFTRKTKHNTQKRLGAIENYFLEKHDLEVEFAGNKDNCLAFIMQFIQDDDVSEDEVFREILSILEDRYSMGEPYFIANLQLKEGITFEDLRNVITEKVDIGVIQHDSFEFTDISLATDHHRESINVTCRYTEYYLNPMTDQREEERPLFSGSLNVKFDYQNKLLITTKSNYNKAVNKMIESLNSALWGNAVIKKYYAQNKMRGKALEIKYDPLTLLVINLVFQKMNEIGYEVEGVNSILFYNDVAPRVKNAKLGGVDLFQDSDIIERISNSDRIISVSIKICKELNEGNSVQADLTIDFRGMLKIILNESTSTEQELDDVTYEVFRIISQLITDDNTATEGTRIFENSLLHNAFKARTFYDFYIDRIESELKELLPDQKDKIEQYFDSEKEKRR